MPLTKGCGGRQQRQMPSGAATVRATTPSGKIKYCVWLVGQMAPASAATNGLRGWQQLQAPKGNVAGSSQRPRPPTTQRFPQRPPQRANPSCSARSPVHWGQRSAAKGLSPATSTGNLLPTCAAKVGFATPSVGVGNVGGVAATTAFPTLVLK